MVQKIFEFPLSEIDIFLKESKLLIVSLRCQKLLDVSIRLLVEPLNKRDMLLVLHSEAFEAWSFHHLDAFCPQLNESFQIVNLSTIESLASSFVKSVPFYDW